MKNPGQNPESVYIGQTSDKSDDRLIGGSKHEEQLYEIELYEHDFQPFGFR